MRVDSHLHHLRQVLSLQHRCTWSRSRQQQEDWKWNTFQTSLYPHIKCATRRIFLPQNICFGFSCEGAECCCVLSPSNPPPSPTSQHTCSLWKSPTGTRNTGVVSKQTVKTIRKSLKPEANSHRTPENEFNFKLK